ncbi:HepT-like ribonuclease domain-containing protein [Leptothrix discophora]|uniref:DUF86 domain-containing protein n=1 Tax=Leptothrix discophora TaxID=89 RepID=A0ABT9FYN5_LEPDI|nr:HepT-like ribonuclease domain-containing protein [Leptothrix discophora]MDP4299344.1 DUF86 domain-containing protein [Leptothrix discophora]
MTLDPARVQDDLGHIAEAIERIQRYTVDLDLAGFQSSLIVQDAVIRNLEVIGEASRNIERSDPGFGAAHPELPLSIAYDMRNSLSPGMTHPRIPNEPHCPPLRHPQPAGPRDAVGGLCRHP